MDASYPRAAIEFMFDTTRSVSDMVLQSVVDRFPKIKFIVPHCGSALSILADRLDAVRPLMKTLGGPGNTPSVGETLKTLHFDLAGLPVPTLLRSLLEYADPKKLHYGSDYPFTPAAGCKVLLENLKGTDVLSEGEKRDVFWNNSTVLVAEDGVGRL
jgi:predicted TIM-barrel fold metal-dependent hydrolase